MKSHRHPIAHRRSRRAALAALAAASLLAALAAAPALAAPELSVEIGHDATEVSHSDERVDYTARVENTAPETTSLSPGDSVSCEPGGWTQTPTFTTKWFKDGVEVGAGSSYTVLPADDGHALQCVVKAQNAGGANSAASLPLPVGSPSPAPPSYSGSGEPRPSIAESSLSATETEYTCSPPAAGVWDGSPTWSYQWLRNGAAIAGATSSTYIAHVGSGEEDHLVALQCEVKGENAGGAILAMSNALGYTGTSAEFNAEYGAFPPRNNNALPSLVDPNSAVGTIHLVVELPSGQETYAYETSGSGWSCDRIPAHGSEHASAACTRSDTLGPGLAYPSLTVVTALGADAPDLAIATATAYGGGSEAATAEDPLEIGPPRPYGLELFKGGVFDPLGEPDTRAGGHPFEGQTTLEFAKKRLLVPVSSSESGAFTPVEHIKHIEFDLPRGFVGNALAPPVLCEGVATMLAHECPPGSIVGGINIVVSGAEANLPMYAIEPEFGTAAQIVFPDAAGDAYTLSARLRPKEAYAVRLELAPSPKFAILESTATICGYGGKANFFGLFAGCKEAGEAGANPVPLFTNPTRCTGEPVITRALLDSWEHPGAFKEFTFTTPEITECGKVRFEPDVKQLQPTSRRADSPTGLDLELTMPTNGLEGKNDKGEPDPEAVSQANLKQAKVVFPEGMAINAAAGQGLGACSANQVKLGTNEPISCPGSSKIGTVEIETPIIEDTLKGAVYIAHQGDVDGSLLGFYMVFDSPKDGILVKIPAKVTPDPVSGQLTVTVDESPEAPFSAVRMHFPGGDRATLITPPSCGTKTIRTELTPWTGGPPVVQESSFTVDRGCTDGGLDATLHAGSTDPLAGNTSPFVVQLTRPDGSDRFTALGLKMPPGLTAYLKGVPYCPDSAIAQAMSREAEGQGQAEIDNPSCPAASQIGRVVGGAGAGPDPYYVDTGRAYLAGPYKGAPLSVVAVVPAVAGPLDLGTVVVRNRLDIDPRTAEVNVVSDPIPTIKHGLLLDVRDVRVLIDRSHFTLNPTYCEPLSVGASLGGLGGGHQDLSNPFQVGGCGKLGFKPRIFTRLYGGVHRGDFPRFRAVYAPRPDRDANVKDLVLRFPRSEFIEQGHFRTICTRVQYNAGNGLGEKCPKGSIYGHVKAITPLLDKPLRGPVFLRSSNHKLPDVVFALHGQVNAEASVRIDSVKGGLRAKVEDAPDVPLTKVIVNMRGRQKGLFVNSRSICAHNYRAAVRATAHNNRVFRSRPAMKNSRCRKVRKAKRHKKHHRRRAHKRGRR